jgi:putative RNA 2'-phosphotransferase
VLSKFLSFVLRHRPEEIGLKLDDAGWVPITELLAALSKHGKSLDRATLEEVVASSDKQRFAISPDGLAIRANQGHSVEVELGLLPVPPPDVLFHGTVARCLPSIRTQGLVKGERHHVHLSSSREVASLVGQRRGTPLILQVDARRMSQAGLEFFCTENRVWLTDCVPPEYLVFDATTD